MIVKVQASADSGACFFSTCMVEFLNAPTVQVTI